MGSGNRIQVSDTNDYLHVLDVWQQYQYFHFIPNHSDSYNSSRWNAQHAKR